MRTVCLVRGLCEHEREEHLRASVVVLGFLQEHQSLEMKSRQAVLSTSWEYLTSWNRGSNLDWNLVLQIKQSHAGFLGRGRAVGTLEAGNEALI